MQTLEIPDGVILSIGVNSSIFQYQVLIQALTDYFTDAVSIQSIFINRIIQLSNRIG